MSIQATMSAAAIGAMEIDVLSTLFFFTTQKQTSATSPSPASSSSSTWVWMTLLPIGFYSVISIYSNAMSCYQFIVAWNSISRTHRNDVEILHFHRKNYLTRRSAIDQALYTRTYSHELNDRRRQEGEELTNDENDDENENENDIYNDKQTNRSISKKRNNNNSKTKGSIHQEMTSCPICLGDFMACDLVSSYNNSRGHDMDNAGRNDADDVNVNDNTGNDDGDDNADVDEVDNVHATVSQQHRPSDQQLIHSTQGIRHRCSGNSNHSHDRERHRGDRNSSAEESVRKHYRGSGGDNGRRRATCNHLFHKECLEAWLQKHPSCPCCRFPILSPPPPIPPHPLLLFNVDNNNNINNDNNNNSMENNPY